MRTVPIAFAFDNNLTKAACVCLYSLLTNACKDTFYDIYIMSSNRISLQHDNIDATASAFQNCKISYIKVDDTFNESFEIRGITTTAYYRLLIPKYITSYDKIIYSDVDVIFRSDLSEIYFNTELDDYYMAGVNSLAHLIPSYKKYYTDKLKLDPAQIIYSGNLIINSKKIREDGIVNEFIKHSNKKYIFQDMDIINLVCKDRIKFLEPKFCLSTFITEWAIRSPKTISEIWDKQSIDKAMESGIIHYNGQKPWKGYCINFDIWWEYYRKSPVFDEQTYFDFFYGKLNELDQLSLWKRVKILIRYFVYGRAK